MKKIILSLLFITILYSLSFSSYTCGVTGVDWNSATLSAPFSIRHEEGLLVFNGRMWMIGGGGPSWPNEKDVWSSSDGTNWNLATSAAAFGPRGAGGYLVFDNGTGPKMWVIGGEHDGVWQKDVWCSSNGVDWSMATGNAAFGTRECQAAYVYNNKMWIAGGYNGTNKNDVWWSSNGADWFMATSNAAWSPRSYPAFAVYNNGTGSKMWLIGGGAWGGTTGSGDAWSSSDGVNWARATVSFQPRFQARAEVFDGKMWVIGGTQNGAKMNDVWYTTDGAAWTQATGSAAFAARCDGATCVYDNKMWYIGGIQTSSLHFNDAWYTCAPPTPTSTPTSTSTPVPTNTPVPVVTYACGTIGIDWNAATLSAPFTIRHEQGNLVFNNRMWLIGGGGPNWPNEKDVWSSADGANWQLETANAAFGPRGAAGYLVYDNGTGPKMWVIGGEHDGAWQKDVWNSSNGIDWNLVTGNAAFGPKECHAAYVFDNKMWVAGGYSGANMNDVWWSSNGADWYLATANAPWSPRVYPGFAVYDNGTGPKMWILGGGQFGGYTGFSDVWYSSDGVNWTEAVGNFPARMQEKAVVFDGKMWILAGINGTRTNDAWYTTDGATWTCVTAGAAFAIRSDGGAFVYNDKMWYIAGCLTIPVMYNDVWYTCGASAPTPTVFVTPADTATPAPTGTPLPVITPAATATPKPEPTVRDGDSTCYPTRAKDHLKIVFNTEKKADCRIYVYDISGKLVKTVDMKTGTTPNEKLYKVQLDVRGFEPGVYYYSIQCKCDKGEKVDFKSQKFIVKGSK